MKVVFTNGCFDLLHIGHIRYLKDARKLGDKLIVGINSDKSRFEWCGKKPIITEKQRKEILESLECVDAVYIYNEDSVYHLIKRIKPDILVKGDEYNLDEVIGHDLCEVKLIPMIKDISTTIIKERILNSK